MGEAKKFVSWRRVSTKKQGKSGLGLEAQKDIIRYFIERDGGKWIADYSECYTGTELSGCVELRKAMEHAKRDGAILIIAKSDRFRNTIEALQVYEEMGEGRIMFCDLPHTDKFTLTLFFALAEREALIVSIRTKQALAAKKARGEKVGAATDKWMESFKKKTREDKEREYMERGRMKNERFLQSRETQILLKILKNVFVDSCEDEDPSKWDWKNINTKGDAKKKIFNLMSDYKDLDESGKLFSKLDLTKRDTREMQIKLCALIQSVRRSSLNMAKKYSK